MRVSELLLLKDYDVRATAKILAQAAQLTPEQFTTVPEGGYMSARDTLVHTMSAERYWRTGWQTGRSVPDFAPKDFPTCASIAERWREEDQVTRDFLATLDDADLDVELGGDFAGDGPLGMTIVHLLLHAMQHRSEVAMMLTAYGYSPGDVDLIFYLNQQAGGN
jgi:uncharacterized damage-inducible protein DinB